MRILWDRIVRWWNAPAIAEARRPYVIVGGVRERLPNGVTRHASWLCGHRPSPMWTTDPADPGILVLPKAEAYALVRMIRAAGLYAFPAPLDGRA